MQTRPSWQILRTEERTCSRSARTVTREKPTPEMLVTPILMLITCPPTTIRKSLAVKYRSWRLCLCTSTIYQLWVFLQGTIGREIMEQLEDREGCKPEVVFVSVGGGGLISGIAGYLKHEHPDVKIVGCQPKASAGMLASIQAGKIVEVDSTPTLSDGTAGNRFLSNLCLNTRKSAYFIQRRH